MASIDTSQRKPRRTQGTPSFKYRNRFALAFLAAGTAFFGLWYFTPMQQKLNNKLIQALSKPSELEVDRHGLLEFGAPRTSQFIRDTLEEKEILRTER